MKFAKYHGLGNDFAIVDSLEQASHSADTETTAAQVCDRHFGVGADGVLFVYPSDVADARMKIRNADGSVPEMCGNGLRCVVKYLYDRHEHLRKNTLAIDTGAGVLTCGVIDDEIRVDMGRPRLDRAEIPMQSGAHAQCIDEEFVIDGQSFRITGVSMGNPHAVIFTDVAGQSLRTLAERYGPAIETHQAFPNKTNVEFCKVHSPKDIEVVVWERGVGITLACGTGACAVATAACLNKHASVDSDITVRLLGGPLTIRVTPDYGTVMMTGPAAHVYDGVLA